jgi:predicted SAM-dependent methyltransferase
MSIQRFFIDELCPHVLMRAFDAIRSKFDAIRFRGSAQTHPRLHLGCGGHVLPEWTNVDLSNRPGVVRWDLTRVLPIADNGIDFIYSEHFIEHIERSDALRLLRECHRVLRPHGVLRLSTPDLRVLVEEYRADRLTKWTDVDWNPSTACALLNEGMREWGHRYVYDDTELIAQLRDAGFATAKRAKWRHSEHEALANLELRPDHDELIFEAMK